MRQSETQYDMAKRGTATSIAVLRAAVAAYLAYLGYTLIRDVRAGGSAMSPALAWTAGLLFIAAAQSVNKPVACRQGEQHCAGY